MLAVLPTLIPVVLASTRDLLQAIHDAGADPSLERVDERASGAAPVREGITSDEMLHGRRIGLQVIREEAYAAARELDISEEALLGEYDSARGENLPSHPAKPEEPSS